MTLWAIVPVKPLRRGKSRLSAALAESDRASLNHQLLERTVTTLAGIGGIGAVLVVSRDPSALAQARALGARTVQEDGAPSLNTALKRAVLVAQMYSPRGILVIPADLPLLSSDDIAALLALAANPPVVVIAPDRHHRGTNAILVSPPDLMDFDFGGNSFARHCDRARRAGARVEILERPSLGLDLDLPEDLEMTRQSQGS